MPWRNDFFQPWTAPQRRVVLAILVGMLVYGSIRLAMHHQYVSDPQPPEPSRAAELANQIDPNTADAPTLAVLPLIGPKRADDIIQYRERYAHDHPERPAFASLTDLTKVRGIGQTTIDQLQPFLIFPSATGATSQPIP